MAETLLTPYFVGELDGEVVGSMGCYTPRDTRDLGIVEFVETAEEHRRKGIGSVLLGRLIDWFTAEGGVALTLCTANPVAGSLYEKHGFWYSVGDGMRYLGPDARDFDETYLEFSGKARVRSAAWGDMPRASFLYNHPEPDWTIKDYLTGSFRHMRFETHFVGLMKGAEDRRGAVVVLDTPKRRVVGLAALRRLDTYHEQHVATLSFRVCPAYLPQTSELLAEAARQARELSIASLQVFVAGCDGDQAALLEAAGYIQEARLRDRLRRGDGWVDMLVYTLRLSEAVSAMRADDDYYGSRKPWQAERVAAGRD